jgi:hypothetical protein
MILDDAIGVRLLAFRSFAELIKRGGGSFRNRPSMRYGFLDIS